MSLAPPTEMNVKAAPRGPVLELKLPTRHGFDVTAQIRFTTTPLNLRVDAVPALRWARPGNVRGCG